MRDLIKKIISEQLYEKSVIAEMAKAKGYCGKHFNSISPELPFCIAAENYIKLSVYQPEEDLLKIEAPQAAEAPATTQATPTAPVTDVAEPVLRESPVAQPQAPKADVSSIINKWSVKS